MTAEEVVEQLRPLGAESYKKVLRNHGVPEPFFGVKIEELKKFQKRIKQDYELSLALYDTGNYDAMYLAGLIADDARMTKKNLRDWLKQAHCDALAEYTVAWVAAGSNHGRELALDWIESKKERAAVGGWATLRSIVAVTDDDALDIPELYGLLERVRETIHTQPNRVRYVMNSFVIAAGGFVRDLTADALRVAAAVGRVAVDMGGTSWAVPDAAEYIRKVQARGAIGKKRPTAKC